MSPDSSSNSSYMFSDVIGFMGLFLLALARSSTKWLLPFDLIAHPYSLNKSSPWFSGQFSGIGVGVDARIGVRFRWWEIVLSGKDVNVLDFGMMMVVDETHRMFLTCISA
ncbi:hypothetical protein Tco_1123090 [Tanacetum coccineum]|uniref:Uncharacterized protein n=1 Tax=Tanacetum coccineum TaxID=301880 RepID=A0ABQ5J2E4_9ASTR